MTGIPFKSRGTHRTACGFVCLLGVLALAYVSSLSPLASAQGPGPLDDDDGGDQIIRGAMSDITLEAKTPRELTFLADGPGFLTLCGTEPGVTIDILLFDPDGKPIKIADEFNQHQFGDRKVRFVLVPLQKKGTYRIRLQSKKATDLKVGSAWMPFPQSVDGEDDPSKQTNQAPLGLATQREAWLRGLPDLPLGYVGEAANHGGRPRSYHFSATGPGILAVALRSKHDNDMSIQINDARAQALEDCDIDYQGNVGSEHLVVAIPKAGEYQVIVEPLDGGGAYWFSGSWLPTGPVVQQPAP